MDEETKELKVHCRYTEICPYHNKGIGCTAKWFYLAVMECDFAHKQELEEEGL